MMGFWKDKRVLITGGAGFIGSHLADRLIELGARVAIIDDLSSGSLDNIQQQVEFFECSIVNTFYLNRCLKGFRPEIIFHNAASKSIISGEDPVRDLEVNALGTLNLLRLSRELNVQKFVHASTGSVYGMPVACPVTEDHPTNPFTHYGVSKLAGEKYAMMYHQVHSLDVSVLRYFHVYGPRQSCGDNAGGVIGIFCRRAVQGLPLVVHGDGLQTRSFTHVKDIVETNIWAAMSSEARGQVFNCASGDMRTVLSLTAYLSSFGVAVEFGLGRPCEVRDWVVSHSAIERAGFSSRWTLFREGLAETTDWYEERYG